jgi:hypothetical protein
VDWHVDRGIVAAACVGQDLIRVWPLPVKTPWWEDNTLCGARSLAKMHQEVGDETNSYMDACHRRGGGLRNDLRSYGDLE